MIMSGLALLFNRIFLSVSLAAKAGRGFAVAAGRSALVMSEKKEAEGRLMIKVCL